MASNSLAPAPLVAQDPVPGSDGHPARGFGTRVTITGRLMADPELRYTAAGVAVTRMCLALRGTEGVIYQHVVAWNGLAEVAAEYLHKGRRIRVDGRLRGRSWIGTDERGRYDVEIIASGVEFLPPGAR
jgi:single-strand DNA-binding protein